MSRALYIFIAIAAVAALAWGSVKPCQAALSDGHEFGMVDSSGEVTDVIVGHNNRGPYYLSWKNFDESTLTASVNGRSLRKNSDYSLDVSGGMISFNSILATDALVRVSYRVTNKSTRATGTGSSVTLNLRSSASGSLRVLGQYTPNSTDSTYAKSIIGLGGDRSWTGGKLDSLFLVSQGSDTSGGTGSTWDRAATKLSGNTSLGKLKFTGSYLHSGSEFVGSSDYSTGVGKEAVNLSTSFAPTKTIEASASYTSSEDTAGDNKGAQSIKSEQKLVYTPQKSTKLSFSNSTAQTTTVAGVRDTVTASGMRLSSTVIPQLSLRSSFTQAVSELFGAERTMTAGVTAKASDSVSLDVDYGTLENNTVGSQVSTGVKVTATPVKDMSVQAGYLGADSTKLGETTKTSVVVKAVPVKNIQIKGSAVDSLDAEDKEFQRDFSMSGTPVKFAKLSALFSQKGVNSDDDVTKGAELQLLPSKRASLSAACKYAETGASTLKIYDYAAVTKPWDFFNLTGSYRQREYKKADAPDSAAVKMSVAPVKRFALTGEYIANPENTDGVVQAYNTSAVGFATTIGSVGVETSYYKKNEYENDTLSDERKLGFALPMFGHGKLTTGYRMGRVLGGSTESTRTYSLGYNHSVGSNFSLSLTGNYTQYIINKMLQPEKTEVSAEASLGVKF